MQPAGQDLAPSRFFFAVLGPLARAADVPRPLLGRLTRTFIWVPRAQYTSMTEGATFSTNAFRNDTAQCVREVEFWRTLKSPVFNQECCPTEATILSHLRPPKRYWVVVGGEPRCLSLFQRAGERKHFRFAAQKRSDGRADGRGEDADGRPVARTMRTDGRADGKIGDDYFL